MHDITALNIVIVDTLNNDKPLLTEQTRLENPKFIVNGSDSKFVNLMTTELHFNMLVKSNDEGVFYHLFTGSETRYKLLLQDASSENNVVTIWSGTLLAEQFSEPYDHSNFFVSFTATDGIARLKQMVLSRDYYSQKKSVIDLLVKSLLLTGVDLPLLFSPAIQNAGFDLDYLDLEVPTSCYLDNGKKQSVYDILNNLLESIGCRLFQYNNQWVVFGLNKINQTEVAFKKYKLDGFYNTQYLEDVSLLRNIIDKKFLANPVISIIPPLRKMAVNWDSKTLENLIPEDVVSHLPVLIDTDINNRVVKYWHLNNTLDLVFEVYIVFLDAMFNYSNVSFNMYYHGFFATPNKEFDAENRLGPSVQFVSTDSITEADLPTNYATLDAFYIKGSEDEDRYASLEIKFSIPAASGVTDEDLNNAIDEEVNAFSKHFFFAVTFKDRKTTALEDEDLYLTNFTNDNAPAELFDFALSVNKKTLKGSLKIDKILLLDSGYYNIRLYPAVSNALLGSTIIYDTCSFILKGEDVQLSEHARAINFTTSEELDVFHAPWRMQLSERAFGFSESIVSAAADGNLLPRDILVDPLFFDKKAVYTNGLLFYNLHNVGISDAVFERLSQGYKLFVKVGGVGDLVEMPENKYSVLDDVANGGKVIQQIDYVTVNIDGDIFIEENDVLYLKVDPTAENTISYAGYWLDKWRREGVYETLDYLEVLKRIYLGCLSAANFKIEGTYTALLTPFDLVNFSYKGYRSYTPTMLELNLTEGLTNVTLIEAKFDNLTLSSNEDGIINDDPIGIGDNTLNPAIVIESKSVAPGSLFTGAFTWQIHTVYEFIDFAAINAMVTARQLTDSIANGGVPTGFIKTGEITNIEGRQVFSFSVPIGDEAGFYEVYIEQDGVISNKEYVEVAPVVVVPTESIRLDKVFIGDYLNRTGRFEVSYIGFSPTDVTQTLQKVDSVLGLPLGSPMVSNLSVDLQYVDIVFPESGSWSVSVSSGGVISNRVSWLSIQV